VRWVSPQQYQVRGGPVAPMRRETHGWPARATHCHALPSAGRARAGRARADAPAELRMLR